MRLEPRLSENAAPWIGGLREGCPHADNCLVRPLLEASELLLVLVRPGRSCARYGLVA